MYVPQSLKDSWTDLVNSSFLFFEKAVPTTHVVPGSDDRIMELLRVPTRQNLQAHLKRVGYFLPDTF